MTTMCRKPEKSVNFWPVQLEDEAMGCMILVKESWKQLVHLSVMTTTNLFGSDNTGFRDFFLSFAVGTSCNKGVFPKTKSSGKP